MPLIHLALVAKGVGVPELQGTIISNQKDSSWQATTSRALHRQQTETPTVSMKKAQESLPGNISRQTLSLCTPLASLQFDKTSRKGAYLLIWSSSFWNSHPEDTSSSPNMEANRVYNCGPTGLYLFAYFKKCCLRVWLPICLKLGTKCVSFPSITDWQVLVHPQNKEHIKNKSGYLDNQKGSRDNQKVEQGWMRCFTTFTRPPLQDRKAALLLNI